MVLILQAFAPNRIETSDHESDLIALLIVLINQGHKMNFSLPNCYIHHFCLGQYYKKACGKKANYKKVNSKKTCRKKAFCIEKVRLFPALQFFAHLFPHAYFQHANFPHAYFQHANFPHAIL